MSVVAELLVKLSADTAQLEAGLKNASGAVDRVDDHFIKVTDSTLSWQKALGILAGATGLAYAAKKVFDIGAAVEETASKFQTVFGPATASVQLFIDDFASMAGLTEQNAQAILGTAGSIAQGMGFAQDASAKLAMEVVRLSGDLSSFNNIPIEKTSMAIQAALTGEREQLKQLGIVLNEADVKAKAMEMSGKSNAAAITQQEKALATMTLITERAGVAVGDLERTQDSSANTARRVTAEILNFRDGLAVAAMPALNEFLKAIGENTGGLEGFADKMQKMAPIIAAWANFAIKSFKTTALAVVALARVTFNTGQIMGESLIFFSKIVTGQFKDALEIFKSSISNMGDMADAAGDVIDGFDEMRIASGEAWETMELGPPVARAVTTSLVAATEASDGLAEATRKLGVRHLEHNAVLEALTGTILTSAQSAEALKRAQGALADSIGDTTTAMGIYKGLVGDAEIAENTFLTTQEALNTLLRDGKITQDQYNEAMKVAQERMDAAGVSSVDLRGSLNELLSNFTDLGIKVPESLEKLVSQVESKWAIMNAILTAPATINKLKTDWVEFFNNVAEAVTTFWGAIKGIADKVQSFFVDIGGAGQNFGGGGFTFNVNTGGPGSGGGTDVSPLLIQWVHESRAYQQVTANATGLLASYAPSEITLLASIRDFLVGISLTLTSIEDKEWSPQIVVNMQGGGAVTSGFVQGSASISGIDQELGIIGRRRNVLLTGDMSI